ncbi:MAG: hypothetical protein A2074_02545 [Candidatus Aquicultor primus]|uniref:Uncharacterized protein n=1 Tax=Candidatus Aquicultor primus TaxID=1797195 RepID=A0A1F2UGW4_9ACTN|nr:MAG: hypothetical protein A2074_02545 [Candidatus Aquicultor primus]
MGSDSFIKPRFCQDNAEDMNRLSDCYLGATRSHWSIFSFAIESYSVGAEQSSANVILNGFETSILF